LEPICPVSRFSTILPQEAMMKKTLGKLLFGAAVLLATAVAASAQSDPGTAPEHKGNTGWTGGSADQPSQTKASETTGQNTADPAAQAARDAESAKSQPLTAAGLDLQGTPRRFPANKTPE
jgi:hypothetical protein